MLAAGAAAVGLAAWRELGPQPALELAAAAMLAAKLPDLDRMLHDDPHHRGPIHSVAAGVLIVAAFWYFFPVLRGRDVPAVVAWGASLGYLSHLALDLCTPAGIPLLLRRGPHARLDLVATGSAVEHVFAAAVALAGIWLWLATWGVPYVTLPK